MVKKEHIQSTFCPISGSFYSAQIGYVTEHQFTENGNIYIRGGSPEGEDLTTTYYQNFYKFCQGYLEMFGDVFEVL